MLRNLSNLLDKEDLSTSKKTSAENIAKGSKSMKHGHVRKEERPNIVNLLRKNILIFKSSVKIFNLVLKNCCFLVFYFPNQFYTIEADNADSSKTKNKNKKNVNK